MSVFTLAPRFVFFFQCYVVHRHLHSFPTRRSSDLSALRAGFQYHLEKPVDVYALVGVVASLARKEPDPRPSLVALPRSEEHTSELQSHSDLVCRLLLEKKKKQKKD